MYSNTLNAIEQAKDENLAYFVAEYFEKNYIGQMKDDGKRKEPRFPVKLWNVHDSTMNGEFNHSKSFVTYCFMKKNLIYPFFA